MNRCTTFTLKQYELIKNKFCMINVFKLLFRKFVMSNNNI